MEVHLDPIQKRKMDNCAKKLNWDISFCIVFNPPPFLPLPIKIFYEKSNSSAQQSKLVIEKNPNDFDSKLFLQKYQRFCVERILPGF
jgi:hypothetical protein